jgi:hypothetical protein
MLFLEGKEEYDVEEKRGREYVTAPKGDWVTLHQFLAVLPGEPSILLA